MAKLCHRRLRSTHYSLIIHRAHTRPTSSECLHAPASPRLSRRTHPRPPQQNPQHQTLLCVLSLHSSPLPFRVIHVYLHRHPSPKRTTPTQPTLPRRRIQPRLRHRDPSAYTHTHTSHAWRSQSKCIRLEPVLGLHVLHHDRGLGARGIAAEVKGCQRG